MACCWCRLGLFQHSFQQYPKSALFPREGGTLALPSKSGADLSVEGSSPLPSALKLDTPAVATTRRRDFFLAIARTCGKSSSLALLVAVPSPRSPDVAASSHVKPSDCSPRRSPKRSAVSVGRLKGLG